jgi:hypothetical protein
MEEGAEPVGAKGNPEELYLGKVVDDVGDGTNLLEAVSPPPIFASSFS